MAFVPPVFSKFGKACSDLLTKKWEAKKGDFENKVVIKSTSQKVTITSTVSAEDVDNKQLSGKVQAAYKDKSVGEFTVEAATAGSIKSTGKLTKLRKGATLSGETTCSKGAATGKATAEYVAEPAALSVEYNSKDSTVTASAAVGFEGFSGGIQATVDTKKVSDSEKKEAVNVEGALQYEDGNLVATVKVEKNYTLSASVYHSVSSALQLASKFIYNSTKPDAHSAAIGGQYLYNPDTAFKGKVDVKGNKDYTITTALEQRLYNPNVVVSLVHELPSAAASSKFAVALTFGEN